VMRNIGEKRVGVVGGVCGGEDIRREGKGAVALNETNSYLQSSFFFIIIPRLSQL